MFVQTRYAAAVLRLFLVLAILAGGGTAAAQAVSNLAAEYRFGQVFLTWNETDVPEGTTFNVYLSKAALGAGGLGGAALVGHHVEKYSATDWWLDPASFNDAESSTPVGFVIEDGAAPLNPRSGLFVHTVTDDNVDQMYFAVTSTSPDGTEDTAVVAGANATRQAIRGAVEMPRPVQLGDAPNPGAGEGRALALRLHGRGADGSGAPNGANFVMFGTTKHGWRQGLARRFTVFGNPTRIEIDPYDRLWVGRSLASSGDRRDGGKAINTWWYGCNNKIYDPALIGEGVVVNYTERYLLWLVAWAQDHYGTDPKMTGIEGFSMGGSGAISVAFNHPEVFSYILARVPLTTYSDRVGFHGSRSIQRLNGLVGGFEADRSIKTDEGMIVGERMDAIRIAAEHPGELPFLVMVSGRQDESIPWANNPPFFEAMTAGRRGFMAYWNNGGHDMFRNLPADVETHLSTLPAFANDRAYPAFSNFTANSNPGGGGLNDGDIEGAINRGLRWSDVQDTAEGFGVTVTADPTVARLPARVDVTLRRLTAFVVAPNAALRVTVGDQARTVRADGDGRVTIENVELTVLPVRIEVSR